MAVWSIVKANALEGGARLDAEYYQPKYAQIVAALRRLGAVRLGDLAEPARRRFRPKPGECFQYIEISAVNTLTGEAVAVTHPGANPPDRAQWVVRRGDVIVSTVRPVRNAVAIVSDKEDGFVSSSGFAVLSPTAVPCEYLFAYLKTRPIVSLLDRRTTATMYPAVSWEDILSLPLLRPTRSVENYVCERVTESRSQLASSQAFYLQAEQVLLKDMGWDRLDLSQRKWWTVPLSRAQEANRLDADHFQPKYDVLSSHLIRSGKAKPLGDIMISMHRGVQPRYVEDGQVLVINSEHVDKQLLNTDGAEHTDTAFWRENPKARAEEFDVLMNSTGWGTIGRANCVLHEQLTVVDNHVTIIRTDTAKCNPLYLSVYLSSPTGLMQTDKWLSGSSGQIELYPSAIARFLVYLPSMDSQESVARLVQQSYDARRKAKTLLDEAKAKVEELIEGTSR